MERFKEQILHPLLFSLYPLAALLATNTAEIRPSAGLRSSIIVTLGAITLYCVLNLMIKDAHRAGLAASLVMLFFFSYGHIYGSLKEASVMGITLGRHRLLAPVSLVALGMGLWWAVKRVRKPNRYTSLLNLVGLAALILPVYQIAAFEVRTRWDDLTTRAVRAESQNLRVGGGQTRPDIYLIVLDAYARHDDLQRVYGFDNTPFLEALEERGFTIARCSQSNYAKTKMSLASTLNLDYIQNLGGEALQRENGEPDWVKIGRMIRRGEARKSLEAIGYRVVAFQTGFFWTEWESADLNLRKDKTSLGTLGSLRTFGYVSDFEALLIKTSFGLALADSSTKLNAAMTSIVDESPKREHYETVRYTLDTLENAAPIPGPKFVFAHIVSPHGPYVFSPEGAFVPDQGALEPGYRHQVAFLNERILMIVDRLLSESEIPPIIVIQGDHGGPGTQTDAIRMNILNAYYLPGEGERLLYDAITPVNTFRLIFDTYFGTDYGLVEDKSYYSTSDAYFDFQVVDNACKAQVSQGRP